MRRLHESTVTEEEIDHLGHLNVRFYGSRALAATQAFLAERGLDAEGCAALGLRVSVPRVYTRHHREQLLGARLGVRTGVLSVERDGLRLYHELANLDSGELSAAMVYGVRLRDAARRDARPLPEPFVEGVAAEIVPWPEHGRPRSLDLDHVPDALALPEARARDLALRAPRTIEPGECDADGFFDERELPELFWGGEPVRGRGGVPMHALDDGRRLAWAIMESHRVALALPRAGDRVQSFVAHVEIGRKTVTRHQWLFDLDDGRLLCTWSSLDLAFDLDARRSMEIPDAVRSSLEANHHPDLR